MNAAVYIGSFDPPTIGHQYIIERALRVFDRLIVAIGTNPLKKPTFTFEERKLMLEDMSARHLNSAIIVSLINQSHYFHLFYMQISFLCTRLSIFLLLPY